MRYLRNLRNSFLNLRRHASEDEDAHTEEHTHDMDATLHQFSRDDGIEQLTTTGRNAIVEEIAKKGYLVNTTPEGVVGRGSEGIVYKLKKRKDDDIGYTDTDYVIKISETDPIDVGRYKRDPDILNSFIKNEMKYYKKFSDQGIGVKLIPDDLSISPFYITSDNQYYSITTLKYHEDFNKYLTDLTNEINNKDNQLTHIENKIYLSRFNTYNTHITTIIQEMTTMGVYCIDMKPHNLLVMKDDGGQAVDIVLADFGYQWCKENCGYANDKELHFLNLVICFCFSVNSYFYSTKLYVFCKKQLKEIKSLLSMKDPDDEIGNKKSKEFVSFIVNLCSACFLHKGNCGNLPIFYYINKYLLTTTAKGFWLKPSDLIDFQINIRGRIITLTYNDSSEVYSQILKMYRFVKMVV